jgi:hypothetical protein
MVKPEHVPKGYISAPPERLVLFQLPEGQSRKKCISEMVGMVNAAYLALYRVQDTGSLDSP